MAAAAPLACRNGLANVLDFHKRRHGGKSLAVGTRRRTLCLAQLQDVQKQNPEVVVFDLGKVLLDFDFNLSATRLSEVCRAGTPPDAFHEAFHGDVSKLNPDLPSNNTCLVESYESGALTSVQFYASMVEATGMQVPFDVFASIYGDIFTPMEDMIALKDHLRSKGVPVYLLSNCGEFHIDHVRATYPWFEDFDGHTLSYEVCSYKPAEPIYRATERIAGRSGTELVFIDDKAENAAAAAAAGWHAVHHVGYDSTVQELELLGLPVQPANVSVNVD